VDPVDPLVVKAVEEWFLSRGVPHFIDGYSVTRDVFTRTLPPLTLILLLEVALALNSHWAWWVNVLVAGASFGGLLGVWALTNAVRHRPLLARPDRVGATELAVFVLVPAVLPLLAGGQRLTALNTLVGNLVLLGLIYATTSYGLLPMTRWAVRRLVRQVGDVFNLFVRAMPLLLLFVTFLFLTAEVWQAAATLDGPFLAVTMGMFLLVGIVFVVARIPREVKGISSDLADVPGVAASTPAAALVTGATVPSPPLSRRQWVNLGLVVLFSQGVQILLVSLMIGMFFVVFGLLTVTPATAGLWSGVPVTVLAEWRWWGRPVALTSELLQVAGFLTAFSGFYFTVYVLTDTTYRREFLDDVLGEVREALAVRAVYLAAVRPAAGG
jgi:hypothetical protein